MKATQKSSKIPPKKKICLIGGTFDPIHLGHTYIAAKCQRELGMDKVIFLPCRQSPHKLTKQNAPDHHRLEMCKLAITNLSWAEVDDYDLTAPAPSYSWRTAEVFQERYPDAELYWLMGTDQWDVIPKWTRPEHLASLVRFIVVSRGEDPKKIEGFTCIPLSGAHTASATAIRMNPKETIATAHLNAEVLDYIIKNQLYSVK